MPKRAWIRWAQAVLGVVVIVVAGVALKANWQEIRAEPIVWHFHWGWIAGSLTLTWAMYLLLISGWRALIVGWGERLEMGAAIRIWLLSNLGKYIPGKVWSLVGMALLAQRAGVHPAAATGSAVVMQLLSLATGAAVAFGMLGATVLDDKVPGGWLASALIGGASLASALVVTSPAMMARIGRMIGRPDSLRAVSFGQWLLAAIPNLVAWIGYGVALVWLTKGTMPGVSLAWPLAVGAFAASYLAGYLFLLAPGGLVVREGLLILLLQDTIGWGNAAGLAFASRCALTVNELGAGIPLLIFGRNSRDVT